MPVPRDRQLGSFARLDFGPKLQQELGQLNYYEGSVDGIMGPQTIAAIKDLQRQAGLPQSGSMNAATQSAMDNYLVHGNNQMAG